MSEKKFAYEVRPEVTIGLTEGDIDDIMCCALEGGITYWCGRAQVVGEYLGEYAHEQIARGGTLKLYDAESDDVWELTRDKFLTGVKLYAEQVNLPRLIDGHIDTCAVDDEVADCIVQLALFGDVVFG